MSDDRTVKIEFDPGLHGGELELDPIEREMWAGVDTAFNIMRETAIRVVLRGMRERAAKEGIHYPPDEEMFSSGIPGAPRSYRDMAPSGCAEVRGLHSAVFEHLLQEATEDMEEAFEKAEKIRRALED